MRLSRGGLFYDDDFTARHFSEIDQPESRNTQQGHSYYYIEDTCASLAEGIDPNACASAAQ